MRTRRRRASVVTALAVASLAVLVIMPVVGMRITPLDAIWNPGSGGREADIFWKIRLPRVLAAYMAGSALATAGMTFQAVFRNSLATPFTLGVASGAALGAALSIRFGLAVSILGASGISVSAFLGAVFSVLLVYWLSRVRGGITTPTMLLAGVAVSFFFSSLNLFTQYISDFTHTFRIIRWLMGGLEIAGYSSVWQMAPFVGGGILIVIFMAHELNLLTTGDELAMSRGVEVHKVKLILFFAVSLMVGGVVAICGPIGFVGLMVPHICRMLTGPDHRYLTAATILFGGLFLTICDTFARTAIAPAEIPVGVVTALLGGPFFLWLLMRGERI